MIYTPTDEIMKIHQHAREAFLSGKTRSIAFRKEQIAQVGYLLKDNEQRIKDALKHDLGRPEQETDFFDLTSVYTDVRLAYDNVEQWAKPQRADFNVNFFAMSPKLQAEARGVVLLISPFNFPALLTFSPLVSMIAGGNAVVIKPSEQLSTFIELIAQLVPQYLDKDLYHIVNGGREETAKLLELRWDHIFYVGNGRTGRVIAEAAAKHLTPTTMELGGKNPVVVDPKCDVNLAARRILWGRFSNAGQICLAPEYVLVPRGFEETLVQAMKEVYASFYPEGPALSASLARVVSQAQAQRITTMLNETKGEIVLGGDTDVSQKYIAPTVVKDVNVNDPLMADEIFGPVLCLVPVNDVHEAIAIINSQECPLAVYVFSPDKAFQNKGAVSHDSGVSELQYADCDIVFENTRSGAAVANDVVLTTGVHGLPMGGIGGSGFGYYTGKHAFEEFTHFRVSIDNPGWVDKVALGARYPPYKPSKMLAMLTPGLPPRPVQGKNGTLSKRWALWLAVFLIGAGSAVLTGGQYVGLLEECMRLKKRLALQ
ncbi:NAD-dependent aldehyde dehydrogenase [Cubamyces sp. BRFM 1775]|nr:NAD-dependent aldehyde dehydrogenase [Cubamyces sp. BRFM 1775]